MIDLLWFTFLASNEDAFPEWVVRGLSWRHRIFRRKDNSFVSDESTSLLVLTEFRRAGTTSIHLLFVSRVRGVNPLGKLILDILHFVRSRIDTALVVALMPEQELHADVGDPTGFAVGARDGLDAAASHEEQADMVGAIERLATA